MISWLKELKTLWVGDIIKRKKITPFIVFIAFMLTFLISRLIVYYFPGLYIYGWFTKTYHIHHYYIGFIFLLIAGWIPLVTDSIYLKRVAAAIYGSGFGLVIDEIGLLLTCGTNGLSCDYWARITYDVVTYVIVGFLIIIYFEAFWNVFHNKIIKKTHKMLKSIKFNKNTK